MPSSSVAPLVTDPAWMADGNQPNAYFGNAAASAGDVNGDGFGDVVVGAWGYDNGSSNEGRAFLYLGSSAGMAATPTWTAESDQGGALFGMSVASAGDVNGDGYDDVLVGAPLYGNVQNDEGRAYLYLGSSTGLSASAAWTSESDQDEAYFGFPVASAGDVNGDGYDDVLVGAHLYDDAESNEGRTFLYLGSSTGLATSAAWTADGEQLDAWLGYALASAGDVNGDGYDDVIAGARNINSKGRALVYLGSASGLSASAAWTVDGAQNGAEFGVAVAPAGDVNGDGYADVLVGAWTYDNGNANEGRAFLYLGSSTGLASTAAWTTESDQLEARLGTTLACAGDVNGDGFSDVLVGAYQYDNGQTNEGRAGLFLGSASGLSTSADWTAEGEQAFASFAVCVASAGDVNGDGHSDWLVGANTFDGDQTDEGRVFVYAGSPSGLAADAAWTVEDDPLQSYFGSLSVASAGDVNGDGYSDTLVGANQFDGGHLEEGLALLYLGSATGTSTSAAWTAEGDQTNAFFGESIASAGDVNGDGYSDVIVGAKLFNGDLANEGRAFVYLGSATGLGSSPAWTAEGDQANAWFGNSVASAGDVNGDGYGDVLVGAINHDHGQTNEGGAFLYLGSATGLATDAAWTAESDQTNAWFGHSVASAGDVNGDGYSDVIVGAINYDHVLGNEGRAFLYLGSATGLATSAAWTDEGDQSAASFAFSVASAGDVNGDGYSDVIIGAPNYDRGQSNEGRAFLYLGSAAGLSTSAAWTAESDQPEAAFGRSVATASDVNGDGYSDVIVGASGYDNGQDGEGRAFLYLGSANGIGEAAWTAEGDRQNALFGSSVASAGDTNGDGYGDVLVGAIRYPGEVEGAFLYLGNEGRGGRVLAPRQRHYFAPQPIAALGRSSSPGFRIQVEHPALVGGGRAFLEWEAKPLGVAFDDNGHERSALGQAVDPFSALVFDEVVSGLDALPYKWRARVVLEDNPFFPSSPWFSPPDNARTETDLRVKLHGANAGPSGPLPTRTTTVP
ncbi:MAG: integrin alpha [Planctomycetota bacterium]